MATAADSSSAAAAVSHHSPKPDFDGTPWAKVVRGDSESPSPPPPSSEMEPNEGAEPEAFSAESGDGQSNAARGKNAAWNKPLLKQAKEEVVEAGPVMGAEAWPALSESAWASPKLPPDSSPRTLTDVSIPPPVSPGPVVTPSPNSKRLHGNHANTNPASTHATQARQRPTKRGGGSAAGGSNPRPQGVFVPPPLPPPPPPPFPVFPMPNGYGALVPAMPEPSPRDPSFRGSNWEARPMIFGPQTHQGYDPRNSSRRGNFGSHTRGDGHFHNNYGSKRDQQDRGNPNNGRDFQMYQQQRPSPRGRVRPVPPSGAAFTPQPAGTFVNPMGYTEFVYLPTLPVDPTRMPFIPHAPHPAMFIPVAEPPVPSLHSLIINQIDYYFSDMNLIRDEYLRSNMDAQGCVPISLIANFPRVKSLTTDVQLIMDSLRASSIVEVQDDKLRRRNDWKKWISTSGRLASESGSSSSDLQSSGMLSTSFQKMTVDNASTSQSNMSGNPDVNSKATAHYFSTELAGVSQLPNGDVTQQ